MVIIVVHDPAEQFVVPILPDGHDCDVVVSVRFPAIFPISKTIRVPRPHLNEPHPPPSLWAEDVNVLLTSSRDLLKKKTSCFRLQPHSSIHFK